MEHSRHNPAPGVKVAPVIMPRVHVSMSQAKAARTPLTNCKGEYVGVMKAHMVGGAIGLGMMSAVKTLRSPVLPTKGFGVRPGHRRRGHCRAGANTCFAGRIPSQREYRKMEMERMLRVLKRQHLFILTRRGNTVQLEDNYEGALEKFLQAYPEAAPEVGRFESAHRASIK